jgi:hypothetical protein
VLHEHVLSVLSSAPGGLTTVAIAQRLELQATSDSFAAIEAALLLSPEVSREGNRWKLIVKGRAAQLLAAIENYADASGKRIFRLTAALSSFPASEFPTEPELREVLASSNGRFDLLPNAMIRRIQ